MTASQAKNMALGQLITNEILDPRILHALTEIPRDLFVPQNLRGAAYADEDLDIGNGRYLMAPLTFARLLSAANLTPESRVLNIGALSGYTAAVISPLAAKVVATENDSALIEQMQSHMVHLAIRNVQIEKVNNLLEGYAAAAPYDAIIISGGITTIPESLTTQLSPQAKLVAVRILSKRPDKRGGMGRIIAIQRKKNHFYTREYFDAPAALLP